MALWGKTDALASTPKYVARKAYFNAATKVNTTSNQIDILASNTGFSTGDAVVYNNGGGTGITNLTNNSTYYVRVDGAGLISLYDTYEHAIDTENSTGLKDLAGSPTGTQSLQRTGAANPFGDHIQNGKAIVFVDAQEAAVEENKLKGIKNAGWWLYSTYTDAQSVTRHKAECLVAMANGPTAVAAGDQEDDITVDLTLTFDTDPVDTTVDLSESGTDTATFTAEAVTNSVDTITYQWQKSDDSGSNWYNITGATGTEYTTGVLTIADDNGDQYRVVASVGGITATSAVATLTVQA